jgi:hypothetical protein
VHSFVAHWRSLVVVMGATVSYCASVQTVKGVHTDMLLRYSPASHSVMPALLPDPTSTT